MVELSRRAWLSGLGAAASGLITRVSSATLVRGMPLDELVGRSQHALLFTPLEARCAYRTIGERRMLVTDTRVRVEGTLALEEPSDSELVIRTLGGQLDGVGVLVHGQAELRRGQLSVGFLERAPDGACWVTGMAQGHYPLAARPAALVLQASPQLPTLLDWQHSAVRLLADKSLGDAEQLVSGVRHR